MKLIQQEQEWWRPPEPQKRASGKDAQVMLASWSNSEITRPLECISDHADSNHVVSPALRSVGAALTSLLLGIGSGTDPTPSARKRTPLAKWRLNRILDRSGL